jgi:cytochrome P450
MQYRFDYPFFWSEWLPLPLQVRYWRAMSQIRGFVEERTRDSWEPAASCLMRDLQQSALDDSELRDEVIGLAITGYETLGDALMWSLALLAENPTAWERVSGEARKVLGEGPPALGDVTGLRYTSMVFLEALRLFPPTWLFIRISKEHLKLPSGYSVEHGMKIYLSPWVVQRDSRFYRNAQRFDPEHFSPEQIAARPKLAFLPFGAGPRLCIGHHFAKMEGPLVLALIARDFDLSLVAGSRPRPVGRMTLCSRGPVSMQVSRTSRCAAALSQQDYTAASLAHRTLYSDTSTSET